MTADCCNTLEVINGRGVVWDEIMHLKNAAAGEMDLLYAVFSSFADKRQRKEWQIAWQKCSLHASVRLYIGGGTAFNLN